MNDLEIDSDLSGCVASSINGSLAAVGLSTLSGIPDTDTITVPEIARISVSTDTIESKVSVKPVKVSLDSIDNNIVITEIPSVRVRPLLTTRDRRVPQLYALLVRPHPLQPTLFLR